MHNHVGEHAMKNQQNKRRINHTGEDSTTQEETQRHRRRLGNTSTASREIGPIHRSTPSLPGTLLAEPKSSRMSVSSCSIGFSAVHRRRLSKTREESVTQEKTQQHKRRPSGTGEDSATQPRPARRSDQSNPSSTPSLPVTLLAETQDRNRCAPQSRKYSISSDRNLAQV